ncbi:HTH_Tnp_Tc3_2 domain-containing protein [Trichonephila clavipes]|nr:HTH_Tnp_Tc3_2 domain-containing protein [Trichonephila clavipes]
MREDRRIVRQALVDLTVTRSTIRADVGVAIVPQTISKQLAKANLKSKRPFSAFPLKPEHRQLRLQWCQARIMWNVTDWQKVVFRGESRFVLGTDDNRVRVWRHPDFETRFENAFTWSLPQKTINSYGHIEKNVIVGAAIVIPIWLTHTCTFSCKGDTAQSSRNKCLCLKTGIPSNLSSRMIRWALKLSEFNIEWRHQPGTQNVVEDVPSRNQVDYVKKSQISCVAIRALALNSREQLRTPGRSRVKAYIF